MFAMFNQVFSAIRVLFQAMENLAKALLHISTAAEQQAKAFADEAAVENEAKLKRLKAQAEALQLPAPAVTTTTTAP